MSHQEISLRRLLCPLPVIRTQDTIKTLQSGDTLTVICTDPGVMHDIPAWCRINGHQVLNTRIESGEYIIEIQVT
ncbi:MAG: sulfurtransferase TusA family protein [Methylococcaceae bacterium]|jgi:tRNA 2-thiouridine synthesizing protein A|nr:sulfurtransferase TusA family protein [Methylococcaceae bacterium]